MKINRTALAGFAAFIFTLPACINAQPVVNSRAQYQPQAAAVAAAADRRPWFDTLDDYKLDAAIHIAQSNAVHTFSGKLPPELTAVVVLRITVDESGQMTDVWVQRAPEGNDLASKIAMASMLRAGVMPRPLNLADRTDRSLAYSETFLFNADHRFQLRTLAPVQAPEED